MKLFFFSLILVLFCCVECLKISNSQLKKNNFVEEKLSNCKVKLDDESIIDLSSLNNPSNPMSTLDDTGESNFNYNPCDPIVCELNSAKSAAICKKQINLGSKNCGDQNSVNFDFSDSLYLSYKHDQITSRIRCECQDIKQSFEFFSSSPSDNYQFILKSKHCCPLKPTNSDGLSLGSVLLIIFFSVLFVYVIGGVAFLKFYQKKNGTEMIPNYQFWSSLPGDVKSGVSFTVSKVSRKNNSYNQI